MLEAERLEQLADAMADVAARLPLVVGELAAFDRDDVWRGRRAARFGEELDDRHRQARSAAERLRAQAEDLRTRASLLRITAGPAPVG